MSGRVDQFYTVHDCTIAVDNGRLYVSKQFEVLVEVQSIYDGQRICRPLDLGVLDEIGVREQIIVTDVSVVQVGQDHVIDVVSVETVGSEFIRNRFQPAAGHGISGQHSVLGLIDARIDDDHGISPGRCSVSETR